MPLGQLGTTRIPTRLLLTTDPSLSSNQRYYLVRTVVPVCSEVKVAGMPVTKRLHATLEHLLELGIDGVQMAGKLRRIHCPTVTQAQLPPLLDCLTLHVKVLLRGTCRGCGGGGGGDGPGLLDSSLLQDEVSVCGPRMVSIASPLEARPHRQQRLVASRRLVRALST